MTARAVMKTKLGQLKAGKDKDDEKVNEISQEINRIKKRIHRKKHTERKQREL